MPTIPSRRRTLRCTGRGSALLLWATLACREDPASETSKTTAPLVSAANPRYFTAESGEAIYLTGSHLWNNLQDGVGVGTCAGTTPLDFAAYLDFLESHGHNFIRLWRWEHFEFGLPAELDTGGPYCSSPQPWVRSGPGLAWDGGSRFDLATFEQDYFDRLRERVSEAGRRGIYVSVMLFDGFCLHECDAESRIAGHPFDGQNNINGVDIGSIADYQSSEVGPEVLELQRAYIRKVVDTVQDLDNVLYEVANESAVGSMPWQGGVVDYVKQYEIDQDYARHPIGVTAEYPGGQDGDLRATAADWISPGISDGDYGEDPPAAEGTQVVISDNDHYLPCATTALWAWKSLVRGLNPIALDCGIGDPANPLADFDFLEPTRNAMGDTLQYARRMGLASMAPRGDLTSTSYALANLGIEYLVLQPDDAPAPFTVSLAAGTYAVEWFSVGERRAETGQPVTLESAQTETFTPPFTSPGPTVLYLAR